MEKAIGKYTPIKRQYAFKLPKTMEPGQAKSLDQSYEGMVGIAINGVTIVGHHVDPDTGKEGHMTMMFDNCGGHGDVDHRYHYHIAPICLMKSLGGTVPERSDWWMASHPESQWPKEAKANADGEKSPLLGWALDGAPIFGPYDPETGKLQVSQGNECESEELDECNGKTLSNGVYAYFITPTYPFVPKCLKGNPGMMEDKMDAILEGENPVYEKCEMNGYAPMNRKSDTDCVTIPQSLFHEIPASAKWVSSTAVIGSLHVIGLIAIAVLIKPAALVSRAEAAQDPEGRLKNVVLGMYASVVMVAVMRALFMLVDPYKMHNIFPRLLEGLLYGLPYVFINLLAVYTLYMLKAIQGKKYLVALWVVVAQFFVQAIMDGLRAYGKQPSWHFICQAFYAAWGGIVLGALMYFTAVQKKPVWFLAAFLSFVEIIFSITMLSVSVGGPNDSSYFAVMTLLRLLEALIVFAYIAVLRDWLQAAPTVPAPKMVDSLDYESGKLSPQAPISVGFPEPAQPSAPGTGGPAADMAETKESEMVVGAQLGSVHTVSSEGA